MFESKGLLKKMILTLLNKNKNKLLVVALISMFFFIFSLQKISLLTDNTDLGRHLTNGRLLLQDPELLTTNYYSANFSDHVFVNHHWLFGVFCNVIFQKFDYSGLILAKTFIYLVAFWLVWYLAAKRSGFWVASCFALPLAAVFLLRFNVRPEMFSVLFIAIYLLVLFDFDESPTRLIFVLPLLQLIWVNTHIYFFIGVFIYVLFFIYYFYKIKNFDNNVKSLIWVGILLGLMCFLNPNTYRGAFYPFMILKDLNLNLTDNRWLWQAKLLGQPFLLIQYFLLLLSSLSLLVSGKKQNIFKVGLMVFAIIFSLFAIRNAAIGAVVCYPLLCMNINNVISDKKILLIPGMLLPCFILCSWPAVNYVQNIGLGTQDSYNGSVLFVTKNKLQGPVFNDFSSGSFLIKELFPKIKPFVDSRPEAYPEYLWQTEYKGALHNETIFKQLKNKYGFKMIYFSLTGYYDFLDRRVKDPDWLCVYADRFSIIFLDKAAYPDFDGQAITKDNMEAQFQYLYNRRDSRSRKVWYKLMWLFRGADK
jgi:hypothetical protein